METKKTTIEIADKDMGLYIKLRAEHIKNWQDEVNGHNYNCTEEHSIKLAELDIMCELLHPDGLVITMEDLLLNNVQTNLQQIRKIKLERLKNAVLNLLDTLNNI